MRNYGLVLSILLLIAGLLCVPHVHALVTGASLSANGTGTFKGDITVNAYGQGHDWQGTARQGYAKVENEKWDPSSPPCQVRIILSITYNDTGNVGGTIDGSIHGTAAMLSEPGQQVGNWDDGAPRPLDGEGTLFLFTNDMVFPERDPDLVGTYAHYRAGTFEWSAIGSVSAQRAYDLKISTTTTSTTHTDGAEIGTGGASVGTSVSKSTGKTQGVDWDFGQSVSLSVDASPPGESPAKPVTGQWVVIKSIDYAKKCICSGHDVTRMLQYYRNWRGGIWISESDGYYSNNDYFSAYDTYKAVVFLNATIHKVYWIIQKPGWDDGSLDWLDNVNGGLTASYDLELDSTPGTYKVIAEVYYGEPNIAGRYKKTTYEHTFHVY